MPSDRRAVVVTYPYRHIIREAISLAQSAGFETLKIITQKHLTKSKFGIGKGKAEELRDITRQICCDTIIIDEALKTIQQYNLAALCGIEVIDREQMILNIFERRASTAESKIQTKLAQLRYDMIRAKEKVRLAKAGEQPGFLGMGKYNADVYYLDIKKRAGALKAKLLKEESRKEIHRSQRLKSGLRTISVAGYTSAGKTTLFNTLTGELKTVGPDLFTTLSTLTRAVIVGDDKVLLSDTVGFVSKLPHYMIDAFKSTLNELVYSDLVLLVLDASEPVEDMKRKLTTSTQVLNELNVQMSKVILVINKTDLVSATDLATKIHFLEIDQSYANISYVSAKNSDHIMQLMALIGELLFASEKGKDFLPKPYHHLVPS
jgi:GTPase